MQISFVLNILVHRQTKNFSTKDPDNCYSTLSLTIPAVLCSLKSFSKKKIRIKEINKYIV
jgi:hypothetical protein